MTEQVKQEFVIGKLGLCVHEIEKELEDDGVYRSFCLVCGKDGSNTELYYPDLTTPDGMVWLAGEIYNSDEYLFAFSEWLDKKFTSKISFMLMFLKDPEYFLNKVAEFLGYKGE